MKMMLVIPGLVLCQAGSLICSVHARHKSCAKSLPSNDPAGFNKTFPTSFPTAFKTFVIDDSSIAALTKDHFLSPDSITVKTIKPELQVLAGYSVMIDKNGNVILEWQTNFEKNVGFFIIEKSSDGRKYTQHGSLKATGNASTKTAYKCIDRRPLKGTTFYRIKEVKKNLFVKNLGVQTIYLGDGNEQDLAQNSQPDGNAIAQINDETTHDLSNNNTGFETVKQTGNSTTFKGNMTLRSSND